MASRDRAGSYASSPRIIRPDDPEDDLKTSFDLRSLTAGKNSTGLSLNEGIFKSTERSQEQDSIVASIKKEESIVPWKFSKAECIEILNSEQSPSLAPIKKEESMTWKFSQGEFVDLSDPKQIFPLALIKKEEPVTPWKFTKSERVELLDSEDEVSYQNQLPAKSSIHGDTNDYDHVGNAKLELQYRQKMLAERAIGKPLPEGANQLFNKLQMSHLQIPDADTEDPNAWMSATVDLDADPHASYVLHGLFKILYF